MAEATVESSRGFWNSLGESDDARVQMLEDSLRRLPTVDSPLRARLLASLAAELLFNARRADRFALADQSWAMARRLNDDAVAFDVMTQRFLCTASPDRLDRYWHETAGLLDLAGRISDPHREILAMMVRYFIGNLSGHIRDAADLPVEATARAEELGQPMLSWLSGAMYAGLFIFEGQLDQGERVATEACGLGQLAGETDAFVWLSGQLTAIRIEQARVGEIVDLIGDFVATTPQLRVWSAAYAFALCELERFDDAREVFEQLAEDGFAGVSYDQLWLAALCFATEACRHVGHPAAAQHLYDLLAPWEHLAASVTVFSLGSVARSLGVLATMLGDLDGADAHLRRAIDRNSRDRSPIWTANARLDLADVHALRGGHEAPDLIRSLVDAAHRDVAGLGAVRIERRAAIRLRSSLHHPSDPP
jgi:tetratricopeptide (TPR) repeat protein